jgi:hypothetical protein
MSEKVEIRLKVPKWISDALKEYCDHFGATPVSTITPLLVEYLWHPSRVRVIPPECISNIYSSVSTNRGNSHSNPKKKKGSRISDNFAPPRSIAEGEGLDHSIAVAMFIDWAKGKGHTQADWNATFRNACRGWIKERMPRPEPKLKEL